MDKNRNRDVLLNFGLIASGKLKDIEQLQEAIEKLMPKIRVVYQTVTARRLKLVKTNIGDQNNGHRKEETQT